MSLLDTRGCRLDDSWWRFAITEGGERTATHLSLALSLLFGVGQLAAGVAVTWWLTKHRSLADRRTFLLLLIALWFAWSGLTEIVVSGMEAAHLLTGLPSLATFTLWRGRADAVLLMVSLGLALALLLHLALRDRPARGANLPRGGSAEKE